MSAESQSYRAVVKAGEHALNCPILKADTQILDHGVLGRAREEAYLAGLFTARHVVRAALVSGEPGIGKTALLRRAASLANREGLRVVSGSCYDAAEAGPYFPFFQVVRQLEAQGGLALVRSLLPSVDLGEAGSSWLGADARAVRRGFVRELTDLFISIAKQSPTVLVIDDIQWADIGTLLLLNSLLDVNIEGLVMLLGERTGDSIVADERLQPRMALRAKVHELELSGLDLASAKRLVAAEVGTSGISAAELGRIHETTRGNPLFIRELARQFRRQGRASIESFADFLANEPLAGNLGGVIDLRLSRLPDAVRAALEAASIFNVSFSAEGLAHLIQEAPDDVQDALDVAIAEGLVERVAETAPRKHRFCHDLFEKRLYERVPANLRRKYHTRLVEAAGMAIVRLDEDELARHSALGWQAGSNSDAAMDCARAAEKAERLLAFETAVQYWQLAIACSQALPEHDRADLQRRLGWACWASGRWEQAATAWHQAATVFEALQDGPRLAEVALALAAVYRWRSEHDRAKQWAQRALTLPLAGASERALAKALIGDVLALQSDLNGARARLHEALKEWEDGGCDPSASWWLSHGLLMLGDLEAALRVGERGMEEARRRGLNATAALLASGLVISDLGMLNAPGARERLAVVEEGTDPCDSTGRISLLIAQAAVFSYLGKWEKLADLAEEWTADFRLAGAFQVATARMASGAARLALGEPDTAYDLIHEALPRLEPLRPSVLLYLAEASLRLDRLDEARSLLNDASEGVLLEPRLAASRAFLGHVAAQTADDRLIARCYERLAGEHRSVVTVYSCTSVQRVLGRLATRMRQWDPAIAHFENAIEQLRGGEAWSELAWTLADYSTMRRKRNRRGDVVKADALAAQASQLFADLSMWDPLSTVALNPRDPFGLSSRELEVLELLAQGLRNREIAEQLTVSDRTVQRHLENMFGKMHVDGRTEAVVRALELGLLDADSLKAQGSSSVRDRKTS
jgi:DNA-binding CsgD family transcriptional regulator